MYTWTWKKQKQWSSPQNQWPYWARMYIRSRRVCKAENLWRWTLDGDKHCLPPSHTQLFTSVSSCPLGFIQGWLYGLSQHAQNAPWWAIWVFISHYFLRFLLLWTTREHLPWAFHCPLVSSTFMVHTQRPVHCCTVFHLPLCMVSLLSSQPFPSIFSPLPLWVQLRAQLHGLLGGCGRRTVTLQSCAQAQSAWPSDFSYCQGWPPPRKTIQCDYNQSLVHFKLYYKRCPSMTVKRETCISLHWHKHSSQKWWLLLHLKNYLHKCWPLLRCFISIIWYIQLLGISRVRGRAAGAVAGESPSLLWPQGTNLMQVGCVFGRAELEVLFSISSRQISK